MEDIFNHSNKLKWSNFHITINLNKGNDRSDTLFYDLCDFCEDLVQTEWVFCWLKLYKDGRQQTFEGLDRYDVETVRARVSMESKGKRNKSLHAHLLLEVGHRTMVQVDYHAMTQLAKEVFGEGVNIQGRFIRGEGDEKAFILHYITKEQPKNQKRKMAKLAASEEVCVADNLWL